MAIRAIQTEWMGYKFRSRLEARWAVFYETLGISWDYEPEGFELPSGRYLPDFYLPDQDCWVEIKGSKPNKRAGTQASELACMTGKSVFIFFGEIPYPLDYCGDDCCSAWVYWKGHYQDEIIHYCCDGNYQWCECNVCGRFDIQYEARSHRMGCGCIDQIEHGDRGHSPDTPRLMAAYKAARSARFEHGEKPII